MLENIEQAVLGILLDVLKEKKLIDDKVHSKAVALVNSRVDFPHFFEYSANCQKEAVDNEYTSSPKGTSAG